jgi:hypothetical protein
MMETLGIAARRQSSAFRSMVIGLGNSPVDAGGGGVAFPYR